jgi:hypothetical protein
MQKLGQFLHAIWADWGARMSGPPTIPLAILALFVSNHTLRVLYAILAVGCGFYTAFAVWLKERTKYEHEVSARRLRDDWKYLQDKFAEYPHELHALWIVRSTIPTKREWDISGANDQMELEHFRVLLEEAGNFLHRADWIVNSFGGIGETDPVYRWLNFVCEVQGDLLETTGGGHVREVHFDSGHVGDLARICSLVCAKLAAKETWPNPEAKSSLQ